MASELPSDVFRKIFRRLVGRHRKSGSLVCKEWHQAEAETRRHLKISDSDRVTCLVSRYPNLTDLDVRNCGMDVTDQLLEEILPGCEKLEILNLAQKRFTEEYREIMEEVHPALVREGGAGRLLTDRGLELLGAKCPVLKYLSLAYRSEVTGLGFESMTRGCTELKALNLTYCKRVQDRALAAIATLPKLRKLLLVGCAGFSDKGMVSLSRGPAAMVLECLEIKDCNQLGDRGLECIASFPRLKVLDLEDCSPGVKDSVLSKIAGGCQELESLNLANCQWVTDEGVTCVVRSCRLLTKLVLSNLEAITDTAIVRVADSLPGLKCLSVDGCPPVVALAFHTLSRCCNLQQLQVSKSLATGGGSMFLRTLEDGGCFIRYISG